MSIGRLTFILLSLGNFPRNLSPRILLAIDGLGGEIEHYQLRTLCGWNRVEEAEPGVTAIVKYKESLEKKSTYDIIIMDNPIGHPMEGPETVKELRKLGFNGFLVCLVYDEGPSNV